MKQLILTFLVLSFVNYHSSILKSQNPVLTLNTEMHTGAIDKIDFDEAGKIILTVSLDKTAKLWDTETGNLLRTFRLQIHEGTAGSLYAGAVSPNGKIIALGGWTKAKDTENGNYIIYLFDTGTSKAISHIGGLPNVIFDIDFSPDGKYMAAALGGTNGIRIYEIPDNLELSGDLKQTASFSDYGAASYKVIFDSKGRLATACYDGTIRLYNNRFQRIKTANSSVGKKIYSLAFSPDGSLLATGYNDFPVVEVRDGKNLEVLYEADTEDIKNANRLLNTVSFSYCGNYLLAGGTHTKRVDGKWQRHIKIWSDKGKGRHSDYPATNNTITNIKALPSGKLIFAGTQPDFGKMTLTGKRIYYKNSETLSFRVRDRSHFKINNSGNVIATSPFGKDLLVFSVSKRNILAPENRPDLDSYTDNQSGIQLTNAGDSRKPEINTKPTNFLKPYEINRSVDISKDGEKIVFGTDQTIYCTDKNGELFWSADIKAAAWAVNISGNDKVMAAAIGNGTIQWYDMQNGTLLLTLFIHPDYRRWILWTPKGYFDCSPGAESLIGWHINQGDSKEALYYPVSHFRSTYYRPDIIDRIFETYDEAEAVRLANTESKRRESDIKIEHKLPPIVNIISPTNYQEVKSEDLTIEYTVSSPGGEEISNVRFLIDGRPVETQRGLVPADEKHSRKKQLRIPKRNSVIQILAENKHGWSVPAEVNIRWRAEAIKETDILKPTLYVLSVGVSTYKNSRYNLNYAAKDAKDFSASMQAQKGGLYKDVVIKKLTNQNANKDNILDGLEWIQRETTSRDVAMIFFAGHGINDNIGTFFFMPYEADLESLRRTCLMFTELKHTASAIAGKVILFVDACHSGNVWGSRRAVPDVTALVNELSDTQSGAVVFTSSTGNQFSLEDARWGNGAFTKALIEGINGKADLFGRGSVSVKTLDAYIADRVKELTGGKQSPTAVFPKSTPDFPVSIKK